MPNILESHGEAVKTVHRLHEENEALRGALNALRAAAAQVVDECSPNAGPSNGAVERLRAILDENLMKTI
jgi:hypothetical protein